jgi:hypothetical protein
MAKIKQTYVPPHYLSWWVRHYALFTKLKAEIEIKTTIQLIK